MSEKKSVGIALGILVAVGVVAGGGWMYAEANKSPQITMVSDNIGSTIGGRKFIVSGKNFSKIGVTKVMVGSNPAEKVEVQDAKTIIVTPPAGQDGTVPVTVINATGKSSTIAEGYTYSHLKPVITSVSPQTLNVSGGELVTVKGSGFAAGPIQLHFHTSIMPAKVVDDSTLTFIAPASPTGGDANVNLEVETTDQAWASDEVNFDYR